jgi:hypothetical protein
MKKLIFIISIFSIIYSCSKTEVLNFPPPQVPTKLTSPLYKIGDSALGGKIAYILQQGDSGYDANLQHGLVAAISDQTSGIRWHNGTNKTTGAKGIVIGTGFANTNSIISAQGETTTSYAAGLARAYKGGGYTNWYLPSKDELNKLYAMKLLGFGGFASGDYWSSTEFDNVYNGFAWYQNFSNGSQDYVDKFLAFYVRAIRAF